MPANLTPEYKKAEELFRQATSAAEKVTALELMLQTIPKHKGTDHMQADIKRRIANLRAEPTGKGGARRKDIFHIPKGAAGGQVALLGTPNSGKSSIVAHLTNARVHVAEYPFSTTVPVPGIICHVTIDLTPGAFSLQSSLPMRPTRAPAWSPILKLHLRYQVAVLRQVSVSS